MCTVWPMKNVKKPNSFLYKYVERDVEPRKAFFWVSHFVGFTVTFFILFLNYYFFLSDMKMRGESKKNSSKKAFISSLFFPGWNEMLQFWAFRKDVYSTLNKTEVYFKMKHHLRLLRKNPNKKHLHFFQNPFPTFLLLFFFFFFPSIEMNPFDQHELSKHSS